MSHYEIQKYLNSLEDGLHADPDLRTCPMEPSDPDLAFESDVFRGDMEGAAPGFEKCPLKVEAWCERSGKLCAAKFGTGSCAADKVRTSKRMKDARLKKAVLSHVSDLFFETINSPAVADLCCRGAEYVGACKASFGLTKFIITASDDENVYQAYYQGGNPGEVRFSLANLMQYYSSNNLDRIILHEIGHACQTSRHVGATQISYEADYDKVWSVQMRTCIEAGQRSAFDLLSFQAAMNFGGGKRTAPDFNSWAVESFADVFAESIYPSMNAKPDYWYWVCNTSADWQHGPTKEIMDCVIKNDPAISEAVCGSGK